MKKIIFFAAIFASLTTQAQILSTDGNTGSVVAPTTPKYQYFLDQTCNTRVRADFAINADASVSTTRWYYEYEFVIDSSNKIWKPLMTGAFVTPIHFDDLKTALFQKVLDSTILEKVDFLK